LARLVRVLGRSAAQYAFFAQAVAAQLGIAPTDLECLALLEDQGPASAGQLAEVLNLTTGAITGVVDRLVAAGFVVRESDPADRRRVIVQLVTERTGQVEAAYRPLLDSLAVALQDASEAELHRFLDIQVRSARVLQDASRQLKSEASPAGTFSAPLRDARTGNLEFASGARDLRIFAADAARPDALYEAMFDGIQPAVRAQSGSVTVRYRRMGMLEWGRARPSGAVALNPSVPWRVSFRGGAANVNLDASGLRLRELSVGGGASNLDVRLPAPEGHLHICLEGGVNRVHIQRPVGTPAELRVHGGANRLEFDDQRFGAVGGAIRLASIGWDQAADRYTIEARGGASRLVIDEA
jgi:DNA-binding MarR family transcriptional regulator